MAKKKFDNVVIKDEELVPTTIGVYSANAKNPIGIIFLVLVFIAIAIFMPDIQNYANKLLGKTDVDDVNTNSNNSGNNGGNVVTPDEDPNNNKKYEISSTTSIETDDYKINNITLNESTLSFTIVNSKSSNLDLSNYFIQLYNSDDTFLERIKVSNDTLDVSESKNYSYNIPSNSTKISIVHKSVDDYPEVTLKYDENKEATLSCTSGKKIYNYLFLDNQLSKIVHIYNPNSSDVSDYNTVVSEYRNKFNSLNVISGVTTSFSEQINEFYFTMTVDLSAIGTDLEKINDDNLYKINTQPRVVKFVEESQRFTCSQK